MRGAGATSKQWLREGRGNCYGGEMGVREGVAGRSEKWLGGPQVELGRPQMGRDCFG